MEEEGKTKLTEFLTAQGATEEEIKDIIEISGNITEKTSMNWKQYKLLKAYELERLSEATTPEEKSQLMEDRDFKSIYNLLDSSSHKNYKRNQEIAKGIEGGVEALRFLSNKSVARRQIDEARRLENELTDPAAPPTTPKSQELLDATEMARRDMNQPLRDIDPILEQNLRMLNEGQNAARVASGGQAGLYGSMTQANVNRAREANNQMIPAIENIRRQQKEAYNRLIAQGINEDDMRFKQEMQKYQVAERRYLTEAQAIGGLRAAGEENLYNSNQGIWDQIGGAANQLVNANYGFGKNKPELQPLGGAQFQSPQMSPLYDPKAEAYKAGIASVDVTRPFNNLSGSKPYMDKYTAISNLGDGRYQNYNNKLNFNLDTFIGRLGNGYNYNGN